jgi:hypothetical protein
MMTFADSGKGQRHKIPPAATLKKGRKLQGIFKKVPLS